MHDEQQARLIQDHVHSACLMMVRPLNDAHRVSSKRGGGTAEEKDNKFKGEPLAGRKCHVVNFAW